nr:MAG TPA: baseplate protein [Caudoviricetes sp.]
MYTETGKFFVGYKDDTGVTHKEFEYREMDGYDEEALAKPKIRKNGSVLMRTLLSRCIVRIGTINKDSVKPKAWDEIIQSLCAYDQDYAFMQIRILSLGDEVKVTHRCPNPECKAKINTVFSIEDDFSIVPCMEVDNIEFELLKGYIDKEGTKHTKGVMRYPNGLDREVLGITASNNYALAATLLLTRLVKMDDVVVTDDVIRKLSTKDREYLINLLNEYKFGYDMDNLDVECPECGETFTASLNNADFL